MMIHRALVRYSCLLSEIYKPSYKKELGFDSAIG